MKLSFLRPSVRAAGFVVLLIGGSCLTGCDVEQALEGLSQQSGGSPKVTASLPPQGGRAGETISIASFNIQVFGTSKAKKPAVMDILAKVIRRFDMVAIQEIRAKDQNLLPRFVELINSDGSRYDYVIGPRIGRTSSKEQYAFIFNTGSIEVDRGSVYTVGDRSDLLHREPLVATFRVRGPPTGDAFGFTLVNIHTDPDETDTELDALADVFRGVQRNSSDDDVILLGDLNVDDRHLGELGRLPNIGWVITGQPTNTRRTKSYDNIVFDRSATAEYTGNSGVLNLMSEYGLSEAEALKVSDHFPVWALFSARERTTGPLAGRSVGGATR